MRTEGWANSQSALCQARPPSSPWAFVNHPLPSWLRDCPQQGFMPIYRRYIETITTLLTGLMAVKLAHYHPEVQLCCCIRDALRYSSFAYPRYIASAIACSSFWLIAAGVQNERCLRTIYSMSGVILMYLPSLTRCGGEKWATRGYLINQTHPKDFFATPLLV